MLKQRDPEHGFQLFDLHGNSRLGEVKLSTGARKILAASNRAEYLKLSQGDLIDKLFF